MERRTFATRACFTFRVLMRVFFLTHAIWHILDAGCGMRDRELKRKASRPSDAVRTRSWHWPSRNRHQALPLQCPLSLCPTIIYAAAVMTTPSYRARLALHQEAKPTLNRNRCMGVLPTLIISHPPHHPLQGLARSLTTTPIHRARVRLTRGDTTPFSLDPPSTRLLSPIPPCNPKG